MIIQALPYPKILSAPVPDIPFQNDITHWYRSDVEAYSDAAGTVLCNDGDGVQVLGNIGSAEDTGQATAANRPIFRTGGLGGQPYFECPLGDQRFFNDLNLPFSGGVADLPPTRTYAFVVDAYDTSRGANPLTGGTNAGGGKYDTYLRPSTNGFRFLKSQYNITPIGQPVILVWTFNTTDARCYVNGVLRTDSDFTNASSADPTAMQLLRSTWASLAPNNYFDGHFYECIMWGNGRSLSNSDLAAVSAALNDLYGIY